MPLNRAQLPQSSNIVLNKFVPRKEQDPLEQILMQTLGGIISNIGTNAVTNLLTGAPQVQDSEGQAVEDPGFLRKAGTFLGTTRGQQESRNQARDAADLDRQRSEAAIDASQATARRQDAEAALRQQELLDILRIGNQTFEQDVRALLEGQPESIVQEAIQGGAGDLGQAQAIAQGEAQKLVDLEKAKAVVSPADIMAGVLAPGLSENENRQRAQAAHGVGAVAAPGSKPFDTPVEDAIVNLFSGNPIMRILDLIDRKLGFEQPPAN